MSGRAYTEAELDYIREHYAETKTDDVARVLGRSVRGVYSQANLMGVKKSMEFFGKEQSGRIKSGGKIHSVATQFKKGQTPHNKGVKMSDEVRKRAEPTMFAPGHVPHNTRSDGDTSVRAHKSGRQYTYVRVGLARWELMHRRLWEQQHGPIPKDSVVTFVDGNTMNCHIDNLVLITKAENAVRNSIHRYPPELESTMRMVSKLRRTIKKIEDEKDNAE